MTKPKLLLADRSVTVRKVVELAFAAEGIDVSAAEDGASAMQKFVEIQPDIVLADVSLEGTSGYEICRMIKNDDATAHIPVLLLVGSFEPFDEEKADEVRADGFLKKPFGSIRDLVARVFELLGETPDEADTVEISDDQQADDSNDIDDLYKSSFAQTAEIEEFDTVDDLLGDAGMDDELIDASYPSEEPVPVEPSQGISLVEPESTKQFDWSPTAVIAESESTARQDPITPELETDVESAAEPSVAGDIPLRVEDTTERDTERHAAEPVHFEPSEEVIDVIVKRVMEKLSDSVVREIAREAVPRIAEKMIREALAEDTKN